MVHVDIDPAELVKPTYTSDIIVEADAANFIDAIDKLLHNNTLPSYDSWSKWCQEIGEKYDVSREHQQAQDSS